MLSISKLLILLDPSETKTYCMNSFDQSYAKAFKLHTYNNHFTDEMIDLHLQGSGQNSPTTEVSNSRKVNLCKTTFRKMNVKWREFSPPRCHN